MPFQVTQLVSIVSSLHSQRLVVTIFHSIWLPQRFIFMDLIHVVLKWLLDLSIIYLFHFCYYALFFPKKITFSKEDESPILMRAFAFGRLFWLIQASSSSSISIILFSSLISFEHKDGTVLDSFDIRNTATSSPATGLPSFAAGTLRAPAQLSALYLVSESAYI